MAAALLGSLKGRRERGEGMDVSPKCAPHEGRSSPCTRRARTHVLAEVPDAPDLEGARGLDVLQLHEDLGARGLGEGQALQDGRNDVEGLLAPDWLGCHGLTTRVLPGTGGGVTSCSPRVPPPPAPMATPGSVRSTGAPGEGQGCPQCPLPTLGCSSTNGLPLEAPRIGSATPSSILPVPTPPLSPGARCTPIPLPGVPGDLAARPQPPPSLRDTRGTGEVGGAVPVSPGPRAQPRSRARGRGQTLSRPRCLLSAGRVLQPRGWTGAQGSRPAPGTLPGDPAGTNTGGRASQISAAFTCPGDGMWAPRRWGKKRGSSQIVLEALKCLPWILSGSAKNRPKNRILPLNPWCSQGSLHTPNPQPRHFSVARNEPSPPLLTLQSPHPTESSPGSTSQGTQPLQLGETPEKSPLSCSWPRLAPCGQRSPLGEGRYQVAQPEPGPDQRSSSPQAKQAEPPPFLWDPSLSPSPGDPPG